MAIKQVNRLQIYSRQINILLGTKLCGNMLNSLFTTEHKENCFLQEELSMIYN
jgi:hypothetical protein